MPLKTSTFRSSTWFRLFAIMLFAVLALAACGGDDTEAEVSGGDSEQSEDGGDSSGGLTLSAQDNSFNPSEISAPAGEEVIVSVTNDGDNPHTFSSEEAGFDSDTIEPGATADVTFTMPDAETPFICNIHGESMSGTLVPE